MHRCWKSRRLIGPMGLVAALALAAPGVVQAYPTMPDGEPIYLAGEAGRARAVEQSYSTMAPEGLDGISVVEPAKTTFRTTPVTGAEPSTTAWPGVAAVAAVSILAAIALLAVTHIMTRNPRRSVTARRIGG